MACKHKGRPQHSDILLWSLILCTKWSLSKRSLHQNSVCIHYLSISRSTTMVAQSLNWVSMGWMTGVIPSKGRDCTLSCLMLPFSLMGDWSFKLVLRLQMYGALPLCAHMSRWHGLEHWDYTFHCLPYTLKVNCQPSIITVWSDLTNLIM